MIDVAVARDVYLPQISRALRRNGRLLITDHGPTDACVTTRKGAALGGMPTLTHIPDPNPNPNPNPKQR